MMNLTDLCAAWQLAPILRTWTPDTGTVHQTLLFSTVDGAYALRAYRYTTDDRRKIVSEHAIIAFSQSHGLPVLAPLPLPAGETILEHEGQFYALFPFASGYQIPRGKLTVREVSSMGAFLGQLHQVLQKYPSERVSQRSFSIDHSATLATIATLEQAIHTQPQREEEDLQVLARLAQRRTWLTTTSPPDLECFAQLETQVIHGDYQETNLFFEHGEVSALIDWDQTYVSPRAWEIIRTLHYAFKLEVESCRIFLAAYRQIVSLTTVELDIVAATYGWIRAHDLWMYEELYLKGNQRVRQFLGSQSSFMPFAEQWTHFRHSLL